MIARVPTEAETVREQDVWRLLEQAEALVGEGDNGSAAHLLAQASELAGDGAILYADIGLAYAKVGLIEKAIESFERGRMLDPEDDRIHIDEAGVLTANGRVGEAEEVLREAIRHAPRGLAYHHLGALLESAKRLEEARLLYLEALDHYVLPGRPKNSPGYRSSRGIIFGKLVEIERGNGNLEDALRYAEAGIDATPTCVALYRAAAELAFALKDVDRFRAHARQLERRGTDADRQWVAEHLLHIAP